MPGNGLYNSTTTKFFFQSGADYFFFVATFKFRLQVYPLWPSGSATLTMVFRRLELDSSAKLTKIAKVASKRVAAVPALRQVGTV